MRILLTIVLLMAVAAPASGLDRKPRKKEKKKPGPKPSPNPHRPPLLRPQSPHTPSAKPNLPRRHPHRSRITT